MNKYINDFSDEWWIWLCCFFNFLCFLKQRSIFVSESFYNINNIKYKFDKKIWKAINSEMISSTISLLQDNWIIIGNLKVKMIKKIKY